MRDRIVTILSLVALIVILAMLNFTTPVDVGPLGVLVFFVAVYLLMLGITIAVIKLFRKILKKRGKLDNKGYLYAGAIAFGPIILLLMRAINTNSWLSIFAAIIFVGLACFLVKKRVEV